MKPSIIRENFRKRQIRASSYGVATIYDEVNLDQWQVHPRITTTKEDRIQELDNRWSLGGDEQRALRLMRWHFTRTPEGHWVKRDENNIRYVIGRDRDIIEYLHLAHGYSNLIEYNNWEKLEAYRAKHPGHTDPHGCYDQERRHP